MTLKAEYITKISDYDLSTKQEVFYILSRQKFDSEVFAEKIPYPVNFCDNKKLPLDSKVSWRISTNKK